MASTTEIRREQSFADVVGRSFAAILYTLGPFVVLVAIWQIAIWSAGSTFRTLPGPLDVLIEAGVVIRNGTLGEYVVVSLGRWFAGATMGLVAGVGLAVLFGVSHTVRLAVLPIVRFFSGIAELSFLPLLILWFGFGFTAMVALIAYSVVFPVLYNTLQSLESVPTTLIAAVRTLGGRTSHVVSNVLVPGAVPGIVTGFRIGAGYAFRALIAAEIFASSSGVGYMIFQSRETLNVSRMFVGMATIGLMWMAIDRFYLRPFEMATIVTWGLEREE